MIALRCALLLSLIVTVSPVCAHIVILEPDAFAHGTNVSNAWANEGITLSTVRVIEGGPVQTALPVYVNDTAINTGSGQPPVTGSRVFAHGSASALGTSWGDLQELRPCYYVDPASCVDFPHNEGLVALRVDFSRPIDQIEILGSYSVDPIGFKLLGADGQILASCFGHYSGSSCYTPLWGTPGGWQHASVYAQRETRDIYGVLIGGIIGSTSIDMIRVNVLEPGTMVLLSIGLFGAAVTRRRKKG